jgi:ATP phosphoribosyltransferase regulatory subunit HisZ
MLAPLATHIGAQMVSVLSLRKLVLILSSAQIVLAVLPSNALSVHVSPRVPNVLLSIHVQQAKLDVLMAPVERIHLQALLYQLVHLLILVLLVQPVVIMACAPLIQLCVILIL